MKRRITFNTPNIEDEVNTQCGVYSILSHSGKRYVGMTTKDFYTRWRGHLSALRKGDHHCQALQRAYLKYGEEGLAFTIEKAFSSNEALRKEIEEAETEVWDEYFKLSQRGLYNSRPMGGGSEHSSETIALILKRMEESGKFTSTKSLHQRRGLIEEFAQNPHCSLEKAAKELHVGYGVLQKFVTIENIEWLNRIDAKRERDLKVFDQNQEEIAKLLNNGASFHSLQKRFSFSRVNLQRMLTEDKEKASQA